MRSRISLGALGRGWLLSTGIVLVACAMPAVSQAATVTPTSLTDCFGKISPDSGGKAAGEPNLLDYQFNCDGAISAYTVIVNQQGDGASGGSVDDYNSAPSVFQSDGTTPSSTESVTCEGVTPSDGINCNLGGSQLTAFYFSEGSVDPIQAYCKHLPLNAKGKLEKPGTAAVPQATVQLVVTDATGAEDGPFTLGRTKPCASVPNVVPKPKVSKPKKGTKAKRLAKSKKS